MVAILPFLIGLAISVFGALGARLTSVPTEGQIATDNAAFIYSFNADGALQESASMEKSGSQYWWLDSGGELLIREGAGMTLQGDQPADSRWNSAYRRANPRDTDNGAHPQNLFRLVTRKKWADHSQEAHFAITRLNLSQSPNRNESNGVFFLNRYQNEDNLYYAGIRVDGSAVIKKKSGGRYYTLATAPLFSGRVYDRNSNPSTLPLLSWIGIRSIVRTEKEKVYLALYMENKDKPGVWTKAVEARDDGSRGGPPFTATGYAGIRTDFMDVAFDRYAVMSPENYAPPPL